jgi:hypothetical protein
MTLRKIHPQTQPLPVRATGGDPESGHSDSVKHQAAAYGKIARKALDDCQQGLAADEALERRRNSSGQ